MIEKEYFVLFLILLGGGFFIAALVTEGPHVGKFNKKFCFVFGIALMVLGAWLAS